MASYKVLIKPSAAREIEAIDSLRDRRRIVRRIQALAENPRPPGSEKLSGDDKYRLRQGDFRIVYGIQDDALVVYVVRIAHRKDVYK